MLIKILRVGGLFNTTPNTKPIHTHKIFFLSFLLFFFFWTINQNPETEKPWEQLNLQMKGIKVRIFLGIWKRYKWKPFTVKKKNMGFFLLNANKAEEKICEVKLSTTVIWERERERNPREITIVILLIGE